METDKIRSGDDCVSAMQLDIYREILKAIQEKVRMEGNEFKEVVIKRTENGFIVCVTEVFGSWAKTWSFESYKSLEMFLREKFGAGGKVKLDEPLAGIEPESHRAWLREAAKIPDQKERI